MVNRLNLADLNPILSTEPFNSVDTDSSTQCFKRLEQGPPNSKRPKKSVLGLSEDNSIPEEIDLQDVTRFTAELGRQMHGATWPRVCQDNPETRSSVTMANVQCVPCTTMQR